jgi:hypothetical protein
VIARREKKRREWREKGGEGGIKRVKGEKRECFCPS